MGVGRGKRGKKGVAEFILVSFMNHGLEIPSHILDEDMLGENVFGYLSINFGP